MKFLSISASAVFLAACASGGDDQSARAAENQQQTTSSEVALSGKLCDLLPRADAEKVMGKALVEQRNDGSGCHYQDARGTEGTGLQVYLNALPVSDQCRLTPRSEPLSGIGSEACIAFGQPAGIYTTVVFGGGGRTFEVTAPGEDRKSERATALARVILSRLGS